jgi:CheY-like chemotaxis protein
MSMRYERDLGSNARIRAKGTEAKLLLIDDCSFVRRVFMLTFGELGYGVAAAASPSEGIRMAAQEKFDIVIVERSLSESQQREIERGLGRLEPERMPIILAYEPPPAGKASDAGGSPALPIHRRKALIPLATQIRELLSLESGVAA